MDCVVLLNSRRSLNEDLLEWQSNSQPKVEANDDDDDDDDDDDELLIGRKSHDSVSGAHTVVAP